MTLFRITLAGALLAGTAAHAAPITYSSRTAFNTALAALGATATTETFESIDPALRGTNLPDSDPGTRVGATSGSVTLSSANAIGVQFVSGNTQLFSSLRNTATPAERFLSFTVPTASIAFGIDLVSFTASSTDTLTATGLGGSITYTSGTPVFFGVIDSAAPATSFRLTRPTSVLSPVTFDNLTFATAAATSVPEPGTLALLGLATAALIARRRL